MNTYTMSNGERVKKSVLDRKVRETKAQLLANQIEDIGYNRCETCERNDCKPVTCAHLESVDSCQKNGHAEKAWSIKNMIPEGLPCHQKRDGLNIGS